MDNIFLVLFLLSALGLVIGLISPSTVRVGSRAKVGLYFGAAMIIFIALFGITAPAASQPVSTTNDASTTPAVSASSTPTAAQTNPQSKTTTSQSPQKPESSVAPTPTVTQTNNQNTSSASDETVSQANAVRAAQSYLNYTAFSHDGLVAQLEYEQFSQADAVYGADNSGANWNEEAAKAAQQYMSYSAFSRGSLIAQLEYDKFTQAQAEYGADSVGL